jgi:hypothetical protein
VVALSSGLNKRGHKVTILCDNATQKMIQREHVPSIAVPDGLDQTTFFNAWLPGVVDDPASSKMQNPLVEWAELSHNYTFEQISPLKPDLIISSLFCMGLAYSLVLL